MDRGFERYQKEYEDRALEVLRSGWYINGMQMSAFEDEFAAALGGGCTCAGVDNDTCLTEFSNACPGSSNYW